VNQEIEPSNLLTVTEPPKDPQGRSNISEEAYHRGSLKKYGISLDDAAGELRMGLCGH
jgi:hypothetical protein